MHESGKRQKLGQINENCLEDKIVNGVRHRHGNDQKKWGQIKRTEDKIVNGVLEESVH